jgi:putative tricarboxylic transport membrane protein
MRRLAALVAGGFCAGSLIAGPSALATAPPTSEPAPTVPEAPPTSEPAPTVPEAPLPERLTIMAPADPGGGWDGTARAMQAVLDPMVDGAVEVTNVPGAGGTIGLAEFAGESGSGTDLMVMGSVMVGAILTNDAPVTLESVTPIAALTTEWLAIVVPADSDIESFEDLAAAFQDDPRSVSWAGGSAGGSDHQLVALIAQAADVDVGDVNYVAHSGGGEALASLLSGAVTAGVSGVSEFIDQVEAGELRILAVSSPEPVEGVDAPTIVESGLDVTLPNWRGVVAPADLSDEDRASLLYAIDQMVRSEEWAEQLERNGWTSFYISGDAFTEFVAEQTELTEAVLTEIGLV